MRQRAGLLAACLVLAACAPAKKLIEFGWDEPDTAFLRRHVETMERTPFDGCVFHAGFSGPGGAGNFAWKFWGARAFGAAELQGALDDLRATRLRRFGHNFLRVNLTPGELDWFDDFGPVLANARLAARLARAGRARGVLLDTEQYEGQLFDYARRRQAGARSWDEYAAQARSRGRELMEAFQAEFPELLVFLTFGYELPHWQMESERKPLRECSYGLLAPFLDGLCEGARRGRLVAGHELSYGYRDAAQFTAGYERMRAGVLGIVADPERYRRVVSFGFGLWLDHDWRRNGWSPEDHARNYFTPAAFEASLRAALLRSDEYVWIYGETPRWWSERGGSVPAAYDAAIRRARAAAASPRAAPPPATAAGSRGGP